MQDPQSASAWITTLQRCAISSRKLGGVGFVKVGLRRRRICSPGRRRRNCTSSSSRRRRPAPLRCRRGRSDRADGYRAPQDAAAGGCALPWDRESRDRCHSPRPLYHGLAPRLGHDFACHSDRPHRSADPSPKNRGELARPRSGDHDQDVLVAAEFRQREGQDLGPRATILTDQIAG